MKCEIFPDTAFGKALTEQARKSDLIVEVGTFHGTGSTRALYEGLERSEQCIYSYETHPGHCAKARELYKNEPRVQIFDTSVPYTGWYHIDLLFLDGSPKESPLEFDALAPVSVTIALDDTMGRKNTKNRDKLIEWGWKFLYDEPNDRNGWCIAKRL